MKGSIMRKLLAGGLTDLTPYQKFTVNVQFTAAAIIAVAATAAMLHTVYEFYVEAHDMRQLRAPRKER